MTMHIKYTCNLCGTPINLNGSRTAGDPGHSLRLDPDNRISIIRNPGESHAHVCTACGRALGACYVSGAFGEPVLDQALIRKERKLGVG